MGKRRRIQRAAGSPCALPPTRHNTLHFPSRPLFLSVTRRDGEPSFGGLQVGQRGVEQPELRGQAAAQIVSVKGPARGAPNAFSCRQRGDERRGRPYGAPRALPPIRAAALHICALPPMEVPSCCALAYRVVSAVSSPSCEGKLPIRSLPEIILREVWDHGLRRRMQRARNVLGKCNARASIYLRRRRCHDPCAYRSRPLSSYGTRLGGGGAELLWLTTTLAR